MSRHPPRRVSLLVRNLPMDARSDELRALFERFGEVRDVYLPRDYYTDRPRGFGFVEFRDPRDAEDALYHVDRNIFGGREISVVMSKESRKTPKEMMINPADDEHRYRSRSPRRYNRSRSPRRRRHNRDGSLSRSPRRPDERQSTRGRRSPSRSRSRSASQGYRRERSPSKSPLEKSRYRSSSVVDAPDERRGGSPGDHRKRYSRSP